MKSLQCLVYLCIGFLVVGTPSLRASDLYSQPTSGWRLNGRQLDLDPAIWTYAPPGALEHSSQFPLGKTGGLLIKYPEDKQKRVVTVIRSDPMTSLSKSICQKIARRSPASIVHSSKKSCTVSLSHKKNKKTELHLVIEDPRNLKLLSFSTMIPHVRAKEIKKDLAQIERQMLR